MDDSDQDFVDLCSKVTKRARKKPGEARAPRGAEHHPASSQTSEGNKRRRKNKKDGDCRPPVAGAQSVCDAGDAGSLDLPSGARAERVLTAKDKVLLRMQQFMRTSPQKIVHRDKSNGTLNKEPQRQDPPEPCVSGLHPDSDEAIALRLQQELDKEAAAAEMLDLEDEGLFFCQICHRDLTHMTPEGRTQHTNRCLDDSEESGPARPPAVPECPICGKKFKSQKSRSVHLKRCSSDMGVAPAVLLQALHRQAEESGNVPTVNPAQTQPGGTKRKGHSKPGVLAKKPRKNNHPLDEDAMVALALSSSLREQEREAQGGLKTEVTASHTSVTAVLKWQPDAGKGRRKKGKRAVPRPPPLLLVQDAQAALMRLQERVSALLLHGRPPSPPTPPRRPSSLCGWSGAAPLWQKSTLLSSGLTCPSDFYTPELTEFVAPRESSLRPLTERTPVTEPWTSILPTSSQTAASSSAPSTPGTGQVPVGSQTLRDLMELAEDGMTLTQCEYLSSGTDKNEQSRARPSANLCLSGFVPEEAEEQADLCVSGFLPETEHTRSENTHGGAQRKSDHPGDEERGHRAAPLSRLASDLSSMVNNPQLSDVQIQVDSGDVFFAHSFMLYARCPLLAEMVHESGFGVKEEGSPAAQRVLMSDVPGQAVLALLQHLYTAHCSIPASLRPHILELASRFDLQELQHLCEEDDVNPGEDANDQAFLGLLRSMWNEEDEKDEGLDTDGGDGEGRGSEDDHQTDDVASAEREISEDQVDEEELEEIYEFAATQRKREEESDREEDDEEEEEKADDGGEALTEAKTELSEKTPNLNSELEPNSSLDPYSRLFSDTWGVYEDEDPSASSPSASCPPKTHTSPYQKNQSAHKPSCELSGRTLLQSSPDSSVAQSPQPSASNLPVMGLSPGLSPGHAGDPGTGDVELDASKERVSLSQGPRGICVSPDPPPKKKEPELIVLSDSSEEMEVDVAVLRPCSPLSPCMVQDLQGHTQVKPPSVPNPLQPLTDNKVSHSLKLNAADPSAASGLDRPGCDPSPDCSPEVSWLIPSTPLQQERCSRTSSSRSSSTQTKSSICRMQLFPKGDSSSSRSSLFSSPALPLRAPSRVPTHGGPAEGSVPRSGSSLHRPLQPCSSTPLHTELQQPPVLIAASPLSGSPDRQRPTSQSGNRASSESPEKTELGSFHLSPLSSPSSSHRGLHSSQDHSKSSGGHENTGAQLKRGGITSEGMERESECKNQDSQDGQQKEAEIAESSPWQSFMDEPPIAFNDSWGLDLCVEANPGCFSLRLEDSGGSSRQERSPGGKEPTSTDCHRPPQSHRTRSSSSCSDLESHPPTTSGHERQAHRNASFTPSPPDAALNPEMWDTWEEEQEEALPLSKRVKPSAQLRTPEAPSHRRKRRSVVPITPMPHYSDMDTPDLKNKLKRFGVRPLPKRQMILKLKEIHQYTHQLVSSDSEGEAPPAGRAAQRRPPPAGSQAVKFKEPRAPAAISPLKQRREEEGEEVGERLSASQGSVASEESERSNPELCLTSDSDSDGGISASQAATRLQDRLQAVRDFILSDAGLYTQILQYQPLVLSQLQVRLKEAGIRLGAAKLMDYLDSQCITFTTAKPGHSAPGRRRGPRTKVAGVRGRGRKKTVTVSL